MLMDQSDNYKISFYKQGNSEPWLIVNCKKLMKQTVTGEEAKKLNPSNDGQKAYNMYVGEVIKKSFLPYIYTVTVYSDNT